MVLSCSVQKTARAQVLWIARSDLQVSHLSRQMARRITAGCIVATNVWRFCDSSDDNDWVKRTYGRSLRSALVQGTVIKSTGRSKWEVEWDWEHPNELKRRGESPSSHLKIIRTELEQRRNEVRAGMAGADATADGEESAGDDGDGDATDSDRASHDGHNGTYYNDADDNANEDEDEEFDDDAHTINYQEWTAVPLGFELESEAVRKPGSFNVRLLTRADSRTHLDYFMYMFPPMMAQIVECTNKYGKAKYTRWRDTNKGELIRFFGLWLTMTTFETDSKRDSFEKSVIGVIPGPQLRRFMPYNRFSQLSNVIAFADMTVEIPTSDPWYPIRAFVNSLNAHRKNHIVIGWLLCIDETMWKWIGLGLPHQSYIPRKPEPLGVELKTVCDVESGIMVFIELQEGKRRMEVMDFTDEWQHTTACTLRCLRNWKDSQAAVIGDSWFASVTTAVALRTMGLHFIGNVKTATKRFPKKWLSARLKDTTRGTSVFATTTVEAETYPHQDNDVQLYAEGWNDNHRKTYVATFGKAEKHTEQAGVRRQDVHGNTYIRHHDRTIMTKVYHSGSHSVDDHNKTTQFSIGLEHVWHTDSCWVRCIAKLIEQCAADAFYLAKKVNPSHAGVSVKSFIRELGRQMIHNPWLDETNASEDQVGNALEECVSSEECKLVRIPVPANSSAKNKKRRQMKCQYCDNHTQWMCRKCEVYCCRDTVGHLAPRYCFKAHCDGQEQARKQRRRVQAAADGRTGATPARLSLA